MIANSKLYQKILKLFKDNSVFAITTTATIASALLSSVLYLCHELTLREWNISPSLVDNPYSSNGLQVFIIIMALCLVWLILQVIFLNKVQYIVDLLKALKTLRKFRINTKPFKLTNRIVSATLQITLVIILYGLFLSFYSTISSPNQDNVSSLFANIWQRLASCTIVPAIVIMCTPSEVQKKLKREAKAQKYNKENPIDSEYLTTFFSTIMQESRQVQSSVSKITIFVTSTVFLMLSVIFLLIFEPLSVRTKTNFWIVEIDDKTYVVPYASKETATVKEATVSDNRICIDINTQMRISIDGYILHYREFDAVRWEKGLCEKGTIYDHNHKLQQSVLNGLNYINNVRDEANIQENRR